MVEGPAATEGGRDPIPDDVCLRCGGPIVSQGVHQLRFGGVGGGWHLVLGNLADVDERLVALEVLTCPRCRHVELRDPPST